MRCPEPPQPGLPVVWREPWKNGRSRRQILVWPDLQERGQSERPDDGLRVASADLRMCQIVATAPGTSTTPKGMPNAPFWAGFGLKAPPGGRPSARRRAPPAASAGASAHSPPPRCPFATRLQGGLGGVRPCTPEPVSGRIGAAAAERGAGPPTADRDPPGRTARCERSRRGRDLPAAPHVRQRRCIARKPPHERARTPPARPPTTQPPAAPFPNPGSLAASRAEPLRPEPPRITSTRQSALQRAAALPARPARLHRPSAAQPQTATATQRRSTRSAHRLDRTHHHNRTGAAHGLQRAPTARHGAIPPWQHRQEPAARAGPSCTAQDRTTGNAAFHRFHQQHAPKRAPTRHQHRESTWQQSTAPPHASTEPNAHCGA